MGLLFAALCSVAGAHAAVAAETQAGTDQLEEIVVTAEKRSSTVQETPISMTAISGAGLEAAGITTVEELALSVPGVSTRTAGPGQTEYEIRGLTSSGGAAATVGFYLDDTPFEIIVVGAICWQLAPSPAHGTELPPIREAVFFGDSLTDAGTFGFRFTTASGKTWAQHVADHFGQSAKPNEHIDKYSDVYKGVHASTGPGGLNYAEGGARAALAYSQVSDDPEGTPISTQVQLKHFLAQHGSFRPDQFAFLYIGTNDVAYDYDPINNPALAGALRAGKWPDDATFRSQLVRVEAAADRALQVVRDILNAGAQRLVVFQLADLGEAPWFRTLASRQFATRLAHVFNRRLTAGLPADPRIFVINMQDFLRPLLDQPHRFGFRHGAHEDACRKPDQEFCDSNVCGARCRNRLCIRCSRTSDHTCQSVIGFVCPERNPRAFLAVEKRQ